MSSSSEGVKQGERVFQEGIPLAWSPMSLPSFNVLVERLLVLISGDSISAPGDSS